MKMCLRLNPSFQTWILKPKSRINEVISLNINLIVTHLLGPVLVRPVKETLPSSPTYLEQKAGDRN